MKTSIPLDTIAAGHSGAPTGALPTVVPASPVAPAPEKGLVPDGKTTTPAACTGGISVRGLTKAYRGATVLDGVSFDAPAGSVTAFIGPNGAGKSTTLRIAAGLARADSGTVLFDGQGLHDLPNPGSHVGFVLDPGALHPGRTVAETLALTALATGTPREGIDGILDLVGLAPVRRRPVKALSLGMRQRLVLGMALLPQPRFLVLDEPTNGLDAEGAIWVRHYLSRFAATGGTVLVSSHLLRDIASMAQRIVIIDRGRIVADAPTAEITRGAGSRAAAVVPAAFRGLCDDQGWDYTENEEGFSIQAPPRAIGVAAADAGIALLHLSESGGSTLEERFLDLTSGEFRTRLAGAGPDRA